MGQATATAVGSLRKKVKELRSAKKYVGSQRGSVVIKDPSQNEFLSRYIPLLLTGLIRDKRKLHIE